MATRICPNQHEKNEWSRMAQAAYGSGRNSVGHTYSAAASLPHAGTLTTEYFDKLQGDYRAWLVDGTWPDQAERDAEMRRKCRNW